MKTFKLLASASVYFVILRLPLILFLNFRLKYSYIYLDDLLWYVIYFGLPGLLSILIAYNFKREFITKLGFLCLPMLMGSTIIGASINYNHWGTLFHRPTVFSELKNVKEIHSMSDVIFRQENGKPSLYLYTGIDEDTTIYGRTYDIPEDRALITMLDHTNYGSLLDKIRLGEKNLPQNNAKDWYSILVDSTNKISPAFLEEFHQRVFASNHADEFEKLYFGRIIDIETVEGKRLYHTFLAGPIFGNDFNFAWEFLSKNDNPSKIVKSQWYYYQVPMEELYSYEPFAPMLEFLLLFVLTILFLITQLIILYWKMFQRKRDERLNAYFDV